MSKDETTTPLIIRDGIEMSSELSDEKLRETYYIHIRSSDVSTTYPGGIGTLTSVDLSGKIPVNHDQYILASINSAEIPYSFYNISASRRNNAFNYIIEEEVDNHTPPPDPEDPDPPEWQPKINHVKLNKSFLLPEGNYNVVSLIHALEEEMNYTFTSSYTPPPPPEGDEDEDEDEDEDDPEGGEPDPEGGEPDPFVPTEVHISVSISFSLITGKLTFSTILPGGAENTGVITLTLTPLGLSGGIIGTSTHFLLSPSSSSFVSSIPISLSPNTLYVLSNLQNINTFSTRDKNVSNIFTKVPILCNPFETIHHSNSYNSSGIRLPTGSTINSLTLQITDEQFIPINFNGHSYDITIKLKVFTLLK